MGSEQIKWDIEDWIYFLLGIMAGLVITIAVIVTTSSAMTLDECISTGNCTVINQTITVNNTYMIYNSSCDCEKIGVLETKYNDFLVNRITPLESKYSDFIIKLNNLTNYTDFVVRLNNINNLSNLSSNIVEEKDSWRNIDTYLTIGIAIAILLGIFMLARSMD